MIAKIMKLVKLFNKNNEGIFPDFVEQIVSNVKTKVPSSYAIKKELDELKSKIEGTVIFEGTGNTQVDLTESVAGYKTIEIYYNTTDNIDQYNYFKVENPNNKLVFLFFVEANTNGTSSLFSKGYIISGNKMTLNKPQKTVAFTDGDNVVHQSSYDNIRVKKVIGYK